MELRLAGIPQGLNLLLQKIHRVFGKHAAIQFLDRQLLISVCYYVKYS